jgi:hypothetical protein
VGYASGYELEGVDLVRYRPGGLGDARPSSNFQGGLPVRFRLVGAAAITALITVLSGTAAYANGNDFDGTTQNPAVFVEAPDPGGPVPAPEPTFGSASCEPAYSYTHTDLKPIFMDVKKNYGGPGIALSISLAVGVTLSAQISGSVTVEASALVASAKATFGLTFGVSFTSTATFGGSWTVPNSAKEGWVAIGAKASATKWEKLQQMGNCTWKTIGSGTDRIPFKFPYFHHS